MVRGWFCCTWPDRGAGGVLPVCLGLAADVLVWAPLGSRLPGDVDQRLDGTSRVCRDEGGSTPFVAIHLGVDVFEGKLRRSVPAKPLPTVVFRLDDNPRFIRVRPPRPLARKANQGAEADRLRADSRSW